MGKATRAGALWRAPARPRVVVDPMHVWNLPARKPGDLRRDRPKRSRKGEEGTVRVGKAQRAEADDARGGEVRFAHSTWEADEQSRPAGGGVGGGAGGGKGRSQGKRAPAKQGPGAEPGDVLDTAYDWLCKRRRNYPADADVWSFRQ